MSVLQKVASEWSLLPSADPNGDADLVKFKHPFPIAAVRCKSNRPGNENAILYLECRPMDSKSESDRACVYRGAALTTLLAGKRRAADAICLEHVSRPLHPAVPAVTMDIGDFRFVLSAVVLQGEPLGNRLETILKKSNGELPEEFRGLVLGVWRAGFYWQKEGLRLGVVDPNWLSIDGRNHVKLMFNGCVALAEQDGPQCNKVHRRRRKGPEPLMRRNTSIIAADVALGEPVSDYTNVNRKRFQGLVDAAIQQAASGAGSSESESSSSSSESESSSSFQQDSPAGAPIAQWRKHSDSELRKYWPKEDGKPLGLFGSLRQVPKPEELVVNKDLENHLRPGSVKGEALMEGLRLTDLHQLALWLIDKVRGKEETFTTTKVFLSAVLGQSSHEEKRKAMLHYLLGGCASLPEGGRGQNRGAAKQIMECKQPAGYGRLSDMFVQALDPKVPACAYRLSGHEFVTTVLHSAHNEHLLRTDGIAFQSRILLFDDKEFKGKVRLYLSRGKGTPGLDQMIEWELRGSPGLDQLMDSETQGTPGLDQTRKTPLKLLLQNEGEYGPGVKVLGGCKKDDFVTFYIGTATDDPNGRHVVTSTGVDDCMKYCNGASGWALPFEFFMEKGAGGSFINSSWGRSIPPNVRLDRTKMFTHTWNGLKLVLIPMFAKCDIKHGTFVSWDYNPAAGGGRPL